MNEMSENKGGLDNTQGHGGLISFIIRFVEITNIFEKNVFCLRFIELLI